MACDFIIQYDPKTMTTEDVSKGIIKALYINRLKFKKPSVTFISGDSGEGKSMGALKIMETIAELKELNYQDYINISNVYLPIQYPEKIKEILFNKEYKKVNFICMHEAREVVKAKHWHSFLNQAIGDVNAQVRQVKRLSIFIVSQFIRDISTDIRYTLNYYVKVWRPMGGKARLYFHVMWKDDRDLEKPRLKKRKLSGYLVYPNGRYRKIRPDYIEVSLPSKETVKIFEEQDKEAKSYVIKNKLNKLIKEMRKDMDFDNNKIDAMVDFYASNPENIKLIGKRKRNKFHLNKTIRDMHDLNPEDVQLFQDKLNIKLKEKGILGDAEQ